MKDRSNCFALPHPAPSDDNKSRVMFALLAGFFHLRVPESSAVGSAVGRIKAHDLDIGKNAEVEYTIVPGDGGAMFDITTNDHNQEGIIILKRVRRQARSWALLRFPQVRSTLKKKSKYNTSQSQIKSK